jgi:hypothetical protein
LEDFALSCFPQEQEDAWRLLVKTQKKSLSPIATIEFQALDTKFRLHDYEVGSYNNRIARFMRVSKPLTMQPDNRFRIPVKNWAFRQNKLEEQILRANKVTQAIVFSCNTVGQYREVSPELIGFLPDRYKTALQNMVKRSPYPQISATKKEIETFIATLAYAALQPIHASEQEMLDRPVWRNNYRRYNLRPFPRSMAFDIAEERKCNL